MRRPLPLFSAVLLYAAGATSAVAQDAPLVLDLTGGLSIPVSSFAEGTAPGEGAEQGAAFGVGFTLPRSDRIALYLGFHQHRFDCAPAECADGGTYIATGFDVGLRFSLVTGHMAVPWIRLAAATTSLETRDLPAPNDGVSNLGWGMEAAVGVYVGWDWIALQPMVGYSAVTPELPGGEGLALRYLTPSLGISLPF